MFDEYCPIEYLFMTGIGSVSRVQDKKERVEVANEFLGKNPSYQFIKFHTHSNETINIYGSHYANNFSQQDIQEINKNLSIDKYFMSMLVTPEMKLIKGFDDPILFIGNYPEYETLSSEINEKLEIIARNLGYDLNHFKANLN